MACNIAEVKVVVLTNGESLYFQTSSTNLLYVLLEDKQEDNSGGVDRSQYLPILCHKLGHV